jgi:hypothetical protein
LIVHCLPFGPVKQGATPGASSHHAAPNFLVGLISMIATPAPEVIFIGLLFGLSSAGLAA